MVRAVFLAFIGAVILILVIIFFFQDIVVCECLVNCS